MTAVLIAIFGALGCLLRHLLSGWVRRLFGSDFPHGTLAVNALGAFLVGFIVEISLRGAQLAPPLRTGILIGFLGGLTTFSTFSYETFALIEEGRLLAAGGNVLASVGVCLALTWAGVAAARSLA